MRFPVTAFIAAPLLYAAWQRRKSRREALSDPQWVISAEAKRAIRLKDWVAVGFLVLVGVTSGLAIFEVSRRSWPMIAIFAAAAYGYQYHLESVILKGMRRR